MPLINADCFIQEATEPEIVGQAHRLPKELDGNRERLPYRNCHSYVLRFSSYFHGLLVVLNSR